MTDAHLADDRRPQTEQRPDYRPLVGIGLFLGAVAFLAVGLDRGWFKAAPTAPPPGQQVVGPAAPPAKIQAVEVEFIPLGATKVATHTHSLHGQDCAGKSGKKVKVRIEANGRKGWDWYTCP